MHHASGDRFGRRLVRYDVRIASNMLRSTFGRWQDSLIAAVGAAVALLALRGWMLDRAPDMARWAMFGGGMLLGLVCDRAIGARLDFHATEGPLAAEALSGSSARRYRFAWHVAGVATAALVGALVRLPLLPLAVGGYLVGGLVAWGAEAAAFAAGSGRRPAPQMLRAIRSRLQRPMAGPAAAVLLAAMLLLLPRSSSPAATNAAVGIAAAALALALTPADDAVVRFMAATGFGVRRTVRRHTRAVVRFLVLAVPLCAVVVSPTAGGIVAAAGIAALLLLGFRILVYRLHPRRIADLILIGLVILLGLVAVVLPVLVPVFAVLVILHFGRRAAERTWLIA